MSPQCRGCLSSEGLRYRCLPAPDPGKPTRRKRSKALTVTVRRVILSGRPPRVDSLEHGVHHGQCTEHGAAPGDRRVAEEGADDLRLPRARLCRGVEFRPHPRPAQGRRRDPGEVQEGAVGAARREHRRPLAPEEDREGEAIAWHLLDELKPKVPVKRMVFHEITPKAIQEAVGSARDINEALVDAQEARRILDRLYGYEVSPVLWKKVMPKLSAGRVQSVAVRLVVDRERERMAFRSATYWDLDATLDAGEGRQPRLFPSRLVAVDGSRVAQGRDFTSTGELKNGVVHLDEQTATALAGALGESSFTVRSIESKPYTRKPYAPFRTTTLQQEASRKLGMSASQTMQVAQRLYENGNITYMRTDSVTLSDTALTAARAQVRELYGADYLPDKPRVYTSKVKNAQEAHEAVRPAGEVFQTPAQTRLSGAEYRLYELIWMRTIASQMKDAEGRSVSIKIDAKASTGEQCEFTSSGRVITFHGFLKAYVEGADDPSAGTDDQETRLPDVIEGDVLPAIEVLASGHETKPPARYTEATLIRELEEREIGRPSTYASIFGTIQARKYVYKKG